MTTEQVAAPSKEQPAEAPKPRPSGPDPQARTDGNKVPELPGPSDADERPSGVEMLGTVLTRAAEHAASEHALASANVAFQINNIGSVQASAVRKANVGTDTLSRVRRTFVSPPRLTDAWDVLAASHLLLLTGAPGDGREHLATFLLDAFCDARVRLFRHESLAAVTEGDLTHGGGHLWQGPVDEEFDQRAAEMLAGRLRNVDGWLVVLWPGELECPPELGDYTAEAGRPDLDDVICRQIEPSAEALLDEPAVAPVRKRLSGAGQAARLAHLLNQVAGGRKTLEAALGQFIAPERGIAQWFGDLPERADQAFALALTALDDLSLPSVVTGARLADELIQRTEDPRGRYGLSPFQRPVHTLLASVEAECVPSVRRTGYGQMPITAVRLRRVRAQDLLDGVWQSFPYLQEIYLQWINSLVRNQDPYVRERVAFVAGLLASHDFDYIRGRLLLAWSGDSDERMRRAAATALRPLALHEDLREIVWSLLDQWATEGEEPTESEAHRRLTAATALGGPVGETDPVRALDLITQRLLPHVTNADDYDLWTATAVAVSELFGDGGSPTSDAVLERVVEWAESKRSGPSNVASVVLLGLAGKPPGRSARDDRLLPPLLRAVGRSPVNVARAAALWRHALGQPEHVRPALAGLRRLAENSGSDGTGELAAVISAIPRTNRERRTLSFEIRNWIREDAPPPAAGLLHDVLYREENR